MADEPKKGGIRGWMKAAAGAVLGLFSGAGAMYGTAIVDTVVKPPKPVANFAVSADGLTVTCQNRAAGDSGWWDFGDGTPLEPFDANQPSLAHTYARPGSYAVKLIVRNFLMDENERSVPVDLSAAAPQQLPPTIAGLQVEPISPGSVAPAAFRIRGEVKNAQQVLVDLGERIEVSTETGPFERLVVFEKPGQYPVQLIGQSGKQAVKQVAMVTVGRPAVGSVSAVLRVTDSGVRTDRRTFPESLPLPPPAKGAKGVERKVDARPGYAIVQVSKVTSPTLKNLKVDVAADKRSAKLTGEWAGDPGKSAGAMIQVELVEEKTTPVALRPQELSGVFPTAGQPVVAWKLPPPPLGMTGGQRKMTLELREATPDGGYRVLAKVADLKLPYTGATATGLQRVSATQVGDTVQVVLGQ